MQNAYKILLQLIICVPMSILTSTRHSSAQDIVGVLCSEGYEEECRAFKRVCERDFELTVNIVSIPERYGLRRVRIEESEPTPLIDLWISRRGSYVLHNSRNSTVVAKCAANAGL